MKQTFCVLAAFILLFAIDCAAQTTSAGKTAAQSASLEFQKYENYFEKNNSGLIGATSYLAFKNQKQFDRIFGVAPTMGENNFLPENAFKSKTIVATIKRGALRRYTVEKVTTENRKLIIWYTYKDDAPGTATFASPLILSVAKGKYNEVVFMENNEKAGTARFK